jgi:hypothetical protein
VGRIGDTQGRYDEDRLSKISPPVVTGATDDRFTPQRPSNEDHRTVQEIMDEADPACSRTQILVNNILMTIVSTAFLVAFVWIFST